MSDEEEATHMNEEALALLQKMVDEAQAIINQEDPIVWIRVGDETINARRSLAYTIIHTGYNNIINQTPREEARKTAYPTREQQKILS